MLVKGAIGVTQGIWRKHWIKVIPAITNYSVLNPQQNTYPIFKPFRFHIFIFSIWKRDILLKLHHYNFLDYIYD